MASIVFCGYRTLFEQCVDFALRNEYNVLGVLIPAKNSRLHDEKLTQKIADIGLPSFQSFDEVVKVRPNLVISINYWERIHSKYVDDFFSLGVVNIHHSYRLRYAGRNTCSWAIMERDQNSFTHGTTLHYIDNELDKGRIIDSRMVKFDDKTDAVNLFSQCEAVAFQMFKENLKRISKEIITSNLSIDPLQKLRLLRDRPSMNILEYLGDYSAFYLAWSYLGENGPFVQLGKNKFVLKLVDDQ